MSRDRLRILWVAPFLLHPTRSGNKIRTLGIVKELHQRHDVHFAALLSSAEREEGLARASEYSSHVHVVPHDVPHRSNIKFLPQLAASVFGSTPLAISRYTSAPLRRYVDDIVASGGFDAVIADFLTSAANVTSLDRAILFQHNVEAVIWERLAEHAPTPAHKAYYGLQARRMEAFERDACRRSKHVIAVSPIDADRMRERYATTRVSTVATGVDVDYFSPPAAADPVADIVFTGGMDWLPNLDGIGFFAREVLPRIVARRPDTTVVIVGRNPQPEILQLAAANPRVRVTGTVPDVRPYLWGSAVAIVPLRVGSGTRLKIYEAMAAGTALVSTTTGAEGLDYRQGENILIADAPEQFADACLHLLGDAAARQRQADAARAFVRAHYSWDAVSREFEGILRNA